MARLGRVLSAVVVGASAAILPVSAQAQHDGRVSLPTARASPPAARRMHFSPAPVAAALSGVVSDERGGPVPGAVISAISPTAIASATSDRHGRYAIDSLPAGEYVVRAHMAGFAASKRESVRVAGPVTVVPQLQLRRIDAVAATTGNRLRRCRRGRSSPPGSRCRRARRQPRTRTERGQGVASTHRDGLAPASHQAKHSQE